MSTDIAELFQIIEGRRRSPRRQWYTVGLALSHSVTLNEQLEAIQELGESANEQALSFLERIVREESDTENWRDPGASHCKWAVLYPNAKGPLKVALEYSGMDGWDHAAGPASGEVSQSPRRDEVRHVIDTAVARLKMSCQVA
jgi:hypothetical protein